MFKLGVNAYFQKIFIPPPPLPTEGTFVLDPPTPAISIPGGACHTSPPLPGISEIFQLGWVPPGKTRDLKIPRNRCTGNG